MRSESEWTESYDCGCGNSAAGPEGQLDKASLAVRELDIIRLREGNSLGYGKTTAKSLGIPYALISLSKSCGLLSDLEEVFGERGRDLLYYATSKAVAESWNGSDVPDLDDDMSRELLGYGRAETVSDRASLLREVGTAEDDIVRFLKLRSDRAKEVYLHDTSLITAGPSSPCMVLLSDSSGVPITCTLIEGCKPESALDVDFGSLPGNSSDRSRLVVCGSRCTRDEYEGLRQSGASFIIEIGSGMLDMLNVNGFPQSSEEMRISDGKTISVSYADVCGDPSSAGGSMPKVWKVCPIGSESVDRARVERRVYTIEHRLRSLQPEDAMEQFESTAGRLARFFDISLKDGRLDLSIRRKDLDDYINPQPMYLLTNGFETWDRVTAGLESGKRFRAVSSAMSELLSEACGSVPEDEILGEVLVDFISLIVRFQMAKILSDSGADMDVPTALEWLGQLMCIGNGSEWQVVGMTPRNRKVLSALGISVPKRLML